MQTCIVIYRKKSHFFGRFFAKLHFQTQGDSWLCAVSWVNLPSRFLGRGGLKTCSWATSCHHVTNAGYIKPSCMFFFAFLRFCVFKGYDKQLYSVFDRHQSHHKKNRCVSERGTLSKVALLRSHLSCLQLLCCIQLFCTPPKILTLTCIVSSSVMSLR